MTDTLQTSAPAPSAGASNVKIEPPKAAKDMSKEEQRAAGLAPIHSPGTIAPHAVGSPPGDEPATYRGDVPLKPGVKPVPTDTIPAVAGTTLTQVPDPVTVAEMAQSAAGQHVPFGRQMNSPHGYPSDIVHDPAVFARAAVPGTDDPKAAVAK